MSVERMPTISRSVLKNPLLDFPTSLSYLGDWEGYPGDDAIAKWKQPEPSLGGKPPRRASHSHHTVYRWQVYLFIVKPLGFLRLFVIVAKVIYPNREIYFRSEVLPLKNIYISQHWLNCWEVSSEQIDIGVWEEGCPCGTVARYLVQLSPAINWRSEQVLTQPAALGILVEMNQSISMGQLLQAVFSKVLQKKRWDQERISWFTNIDERE